MGPVIEMLPMMVVMVVVPVIACLILGRGSRVGSLGHAVGRVVVSTLFRLAIGTALTVRQREVILLIFVVIDILIEIVVNAHFQSILASIWSSGQRH